MKEGGNAKTKVDITVTVRVDSGGNSNGWEQVTVNGTTYEYKFTGGSMGGGNHTAKLNTGENVLDIALKDHEDRYSIASVTLDPPSPQFVPSVENEYLAHIDDANTAEAQTTYTVNVQDAQNGNSIPCHPMLQNRP